MLPVPDCCKIRPERAAAYAAAVPQSRLTAPQGRPRKLAGVLGFAGMLLWATCTAAGDAPPGEIPTAFSARVDSFDYAQREVMIPMRDGVKLKTLILIPRGAQHAPILLTRTPYGATERIERNVSAHLAAVIDSSDVADELVAHEGYIRVLQDVRGKHGSEGDYLMTRPLLGPLNRGSVDHHRLAGQKRPRDQRQGRHPRDLV
jgi:predicted acyl esterase